MSQNPNINLTSDLQYLESKNSYGDLERVSPFQPIRSCAVEKASQPSLAS